MLEKLLVIVSAPADDTVSITGIAPLRKSPTKDPQNKAVMTHLLLASALSTHLHPPQSIVHVLERTIFTAVWSQLSVCSTEISSLERFVWTF